MAQPPPLPPRRPSAISISSASDSSITTPLPRQGTIHLTPDRAARRPSADKSFQYPTELNDPRTSSTQSLRPVESAGENRRTLLIIYIHGFLGDETSFKSFPAHVHNILTITLAESHVVYTKIYPRYKSRKNVTVARDAFSNWLKPHESSKTDIILVGHSLGGILAAEVVLLQSQNPTTPNIFQHHIIGQIAIDVPFLGLHPSVVGTGIASLFRSSPEAPTSPQPSDSAGSNNLSPVSSLSESLFTSSDSHFNPSYTNDVHLAKRSGKWERGMYFWSKHWGNLARATKSYVTSHLEFGGCLADYVGLRKRYDAIRDLEDIDDFASKVGSNTTAKRRVRFVNYYSASTGRPKKGKEDTAKPSSDQVDIPKSDGDMVSTTSGSISRQSSDTDRDETPMASPRLSLEEYRNGEFVLKELEAMQMDDDEQESSQLSKTSTEDISALAPPSTTTSSLEDDLPPIPPSPIPPADFDESKYRSSDGQKIARKDYERQRRAYEQAVRDRDEAIADRAEILKMRQRRASDAFASDNDQANEESLPNTTAVTETPSASQGVQINEPNDQDTSTDQKDNKPAKKRRDRKFCALPSKDPKTGKRDPTWIRVPMQDMDEVTAHTSMFVVTETYTKMIGDMTDRIEGWLSEDATRRMILEMAVSEAR